MDMQGPTENQPELTAEEVVNVEELQDASWEPPPPSVADSIFAGRQVRLEQKTGAKTSSSPIRPLPTPAKPSGAPIGTVKQTKHALKAQACCLRKYRTACSDRLAYMAKPNRRFVLSLWREYGDRLPPETINRLRDLLEGEDNFMPDQAYDYFVHMRRANKKMKRVRKSKQREDLQEVCQDRRFVWARNATVDFARGVQKRLAEPTSYQLSGGMLRLSDVIKDEICCYMRMRPPSRCDQSPKGKFMLDISDKIAVWIDQILMESDERMLFVDIDEDEDVVAAAAGGDDDDFADDFLNMMGDGGRSKSSETPAYLMFTGEMAEVFEILTKEMSSQGDKQLISHGKFTQTYAEAANTLKSTPDFTATDYDKKLSDSVNSELTSLTSSVTPAPLKPFMTDMVDLCSKFLSQYAVYSKDKGPAFKLLVKTMKQEGSKQLYAYGKAKRTYDQAAVELEKSKSLEADHEDTDLAGKIKSSLDSLMKPVTPADLAKDMEETLDVVPKYLAQVAVDEVERGPAFEVLVKALEGKGDQPFLPQDKFLKTNQHAAYQLKEARGLATTNPDTSIQPVIKQNLEHVAQSATPPALAAEMPDVTTRCADYLSALSRDRARAFELLIAKMKEKGSAKLVARKSYSLTFGDGAEEILKTPCMIPFLPIKDIADEVQATLNNEMASKTPDDLKAAMRGTIQDVSKYLSQLVAFKSGEGGPKYPQELLIAVMKSQGSTQLLKYKMYGQSYSDAADQLKYAPTLETDMDDPNLTTTIAATLSSKMEDWLVDHVVKDMDGLIVQASKFLSKRAVEKSAALDHLLKEMNKMGDAPLAMIQEYQHSYKECANKVSHADTLTTTNVDKPTYQVVRSKLMTLVEKAPAPPEQAALMPGIVEEVSEFLAKSMPQNNDDKKKMLTELLSRKGKNILTTQGIYKITYMEGAQEIDGSPLGDGLTCTNTQLRDAIKTSIDKSLPSPKIVQTLQEQSKKGATLLSTVTERRGVEFDEIHKELTKKGDAELVSFGDFKISNKEAAKMLQDAPNFIGEHPVPAVEENLKEKLIKKGSGDAAEESVGIVSKYIASVANEKCGRDVDFKAFSEMVAAMEKQGNAVLAEKGKEKMTFVDATNKLNNAIEFSSPGADPALKQTIKDKVDKIVADPNEPTMKDCIDKSSGYLAKFMVDRLAVMEYLTNELQKRGEADLVKIASDPLTHVEAAKILIENEDWTATCVDNAESGKLKPILTAVGAGIPAPQKKAMADLIEDATKYLAQREIDRAAAKRLKPHNMKFPSMQDASRFLDQYADHLIDSKDAIAFLKRYGITLSDKEYEDFLGPYFGRFGVRLKQKQAETSERAKNRAADAVAGKGVGAGGAGGVGAGGVGAGSVGAGGVGAGGVGAGGVGAGGVGGGGVGGVGAGGVGAGGVGAGGVGSGGVGVDGAGGKGGAGGRGVGADGRGGGADGRGGGSDGRGGSAGSRGGLAGGEKSQAQKFLEEKLKGAGNETFFQQPPSKMSYKEAGDILSAPQIRDNQSVQGSPDTDRLQNKFEKILHNYIDDKTPADMKADMQDAIIESSRPLSENFLTKHYRKMIEKMLISEMQRRGDEILIDVDSVTESYFFAAQRIKKASELMAKNPCSRVSLFIQRKLEEKMKCRAPRKYNFAMKDYVRQVSEYLSEYVTKPEADIEAYVSLLHEMEAAGDQVLIATPQFQKSFADSAAYLRQLTTNKDEINRPNPALNTELGTKLKKLIADAQADTPNMNGVIDQTTPLLVSYVMLQEEKNKALGVLIEQLEKANELCLLRHGTIRKTHRQGAQMLSGKNAYELPVPQADPVVFRKIEIKLKNILLDRGPDVLGQFSPFIDDLVKEVAQYLSVKFLEPDVVTTCICPKKSVCVQCEIWREECLRRKASTRCCSRHASKPSTASSHTVSPGTSTSGTVTTRRPCCQRRPPIIQRVEIISTSPFNINYGRDLSPPCLLPKDPKVSLEVSSSIPRSNETISSSDSSRYHYLSPYSTPPISLSSKNSPETGFPKVTSEPSTISISTSISSGATAGADSPHYQSLRPSISPITNTPETCLPESMSKPSKITNSISKSSKAITSSDTPLYNSSSPCLTSSISLNGSEKVFPSSQFIGSTGFHYTSIVQNSFDPNAMNAEIIENNLEPSSKDSDSVEKTGKIPASQKNSLRRIPKSWCLTDLIKSQEASGLNNEPGVIQNLDNFVHKAKLPIASTDQMLEWNGVMVSLLWNVQSWRRWIQEVIDKADGLTGTILEPMSWEAFRTSVNREASQWRQYNLFSRQLAEKLGARYKDKMIVSPTHATIQTYEYIACQREMVQIIDMFDWWTQWLTDIVKEADSLPQNERTKTSINTMRMWMHFVQKVQKHAEDWRKYNVYLKQRWEQTYERFTSGFYPEWGQTGPVWVVSAGGAVPAGACGAGLHRGEMTWLARSTHRRAVLPGALIPSKGCCMLYVKGVAHLYDKYQVLCNADAVWKLWSSGAIHKHAVSAASGVYVGRVMYRGSHLVGGVLPPSHRCHVAILGKQFEFDCYELLVARGGRRARRKR